MKNQLIDFLSAVDNLSHFHTLQRWKRSTKTFIHECIYTVDEHTPELERKAWPEYGERPDIDWFLDEVLDGEELDEVIDKSRQNMISHIMRAAELHRVLFYPNFKVALIFDDKGEAEEHIEERTKFMFRHLPEWFRSRFKIKQKQGWFWVETFDGRPWGSYIMPIPRDPEMLRGKTFTWLSWEEMAKQAWAERAMRAAKPVIQGKRNPKTGKWEKGRFFAITTPIPGSFHEKLLGDEEVRDYAISLARGEQEVA